MQFRNRRSVVFGLIAFAAVTGLPPCALRA